MSVSARDQTRDWNLVLLVLDTARYDAVSEATAPTVATLADGGTRFTSAHAAAPWTLPSHASVFTGSYPSRHGAHAGHKRLEPGRPTLAELLSAAGYETVGVSNNTWVSGEFGFERGFERFRRTWQYVQSETDLGRIARTTEGGETLRALARAVFDGNPAVNVANALYGRFLRKREDSGARRTNEWIDGWLRERTDDGDDRPFFLFVNYLEPHLEYRPPREHAAPFLPDGVAYDEAMAVEQDAWRYVAGDLSLGEADFRALRGLYRGEVSYLDARIADLVGTLRDAGEWEDTVLVVTGDHGENVGDHGLMDHQYCLYRTLLHVPLVVRGGAFDGGGAVDDLVSLVDLAPTLLDVAGVEATDAREGFQGRSFHPDSDAPVRERVFAEYRAPQPSMEALERRVGTLDGAVRRFDRSLRAVRTREWKLVRGSDGGRELYHLPTDPGETDDRAAADPGRVESLAGRLDDWLGSFEHAPTGGEAAMSAATRERLEELGYLQ
jgi:arylsulfatase A-like enzyme